ncbi:RING finger membrane protein [Rasamsonia emersonii CBS 393.64]|uniref:RING-type E3 ubiquitin transferase n=1 Tax=Rasamsonia emersonii (strain ATCC 16479 / CBS 393.64 / IMI 116815) TaxID=1408163 RepID=A0A0F4YSW3_RASE3|nr:RING finger membrane protein [Rasamsonia emersonii CBS 393.64]KKA21175.1 RING finger membrane protein [Rasamsonia emersonii CBS 393.64]
MWIRGEGNPEQVLRIIQEEGRQEELGWVVSAMTRLQRANSARNVLRNDRREDLFDVPDIVSEESNGRPLSFNDPGWTGNRHGYGESSAMSGALTTDDDFMAASAGPSFQPSSPLERSNDDFGFQAPSISSESSEHTEERTDALRPGSADEGHPPEPRNSGPEVIAGQAQAGSGESSTTGIRGVDGPSDDTHVNSAESAAPVPQNLVDRVLDWLWGDIVPRQGAEEPGHDDEHIIEDPALEAPFVPVQNRQNAAGGGRAGNQFAAPGPDGEVNDVDAVEEADDFEGILELIGMQGPIFGLLQNGVFSALLISFTVAVGIWLPYLWGKIALVFLTNPIQLFVGVPLALLSITADVAVDTLIGSVGYILYWVSIVLRFLLRPVDGFVPVFNWIPKNASVTNTSLSLIDGSSQRLRRVIDSFFNFHESDLPMFSVLSHQALRIHEARVMGLFRLLFGIGKFILHDLPLRLLSQGFRQTLLLGISRIDPVAVLAKLRHSLQMLDRSMFFSFGSLDWLNSKVVVSVPADQIPSDYDLAQWDTKDRIIAIIIGYIFASLLGLLYLKITGLISGVNRGQRIEGVVADVLHQAGGVMKVILIIGIEMIVFPLYCGLLLDLALMPLFENATLASRIEFTKSSPLTSLFVHWFVGTCYMFHFALFVSMCRKIMRSGVLYFIRDPDDPTFHPVRDVLERNIMTQLRKIAFSALVYGALVIVCLGGVVWGLSFAFEGVLPIHWSSNIPVLEFPVDLLFYNFVMPFLIRSLKPSDGLHAMYDWWFHKCARLLRLTEFLFGERRRDEEGRHVRRTWRDVFAGKKGDPEHPVVGEEQRRIAEKEGRDVYFLRDGRYVRAPASDQVRIPKGGQVFLEVTEDNKRVDGAPDRDDGLHGRKSDMFTKVYIPPFFRLRIAAFIFLIWVFAAITGVGVTVVPLVLGRRMISSLFPSAIRVNDIYAFSAGIYVLGGAAYALCYCRTGYSILKERLRPVFASPRQAIAGAREVALQTLRLIYVSAAFVLFIPSLFALLTELYVLVPLHTYLEDHQTHVIHFIQDWTLGVLYVQMALKFIQWRSTSRPALALNAIVRDGWLRPNASIATRAFILPVSVLALCAVVLPLFLGFIVNTVLFHNSAAAIHAKVYRYSYPASFMAGLMVWFAYLLRRQVEVWRAHIRDDVYLIGERLHNFGEKRARDVTSVPPRMRTS